MDNAINPASGTVEKGNPRIAAVGDNCVDVYVGDRDGRFPGGNALNVAVLAAGEGADAAYAGSVGDDADGMALIAAAAAAGVDVSMVERLPGRTGVTTVRLTDGEREFVAEQYGVSLSFDLDEACVAWLRGFDWIHSARIADPDGRLSALARAGMPVSRDFGTELRDGAPAASAVGHLAIAFFSAADRGEAERRADELVALGARSAIGMIGSQGAILRSAGLALHEPAVAIDPVDTLGAGDAFIAAYVTGALRGEKAEDALRAAAAAAARTCARLGAWGALETTEVGR